MAVKSNQQLLIKAAQISQAARYILNKRYRQKIAENTSIVTQLRKDRDRSLLVDILSGASKGGLLGSGIGGIEWTWGALQNNDYYPTVIEKGITGAVGAGLPLGATIGGLYNAITHHSRKQKAIKQLKELGIEE